MYISYISTVMFVWQNQTLPIVWIGIQQSLIAVYLALYHRPRCKIQYYCKILKTWTSFMYVPYIITVKFGWQNPPRSFVLMTEQWKTSAKWYQKQCLSTFMAQFILVPFFVFTDDVISITKKYNITYRLSKSSTFS